MHKENYSEMKKHILISIILFPFLVSAQYHSWDGNGLSPYSTVRCLNIFINVIYDVHPEANNSFLDTLYWPPIVDPNMEGINNFAIPNYLLDWMDTIYTPNTLNGICTRLYGESSFDNFQIVGDFMVVNILESFIISNGGFDRYGIPKAAFKMINNHGFETIFLHNNLNDYDLDHNDSLDFVNILIRNISSQYGGLNPGSGYGRFVFDSIYIGEKRLVYRTVQCVGDGDFFVNPTGVLTHEISHNLFGSNDFHTSGGNHRGSGCPMPFLNIQGG